MFDFLEGVYTDVRIEEKFETKITYKNGVLVEQKARSSKGAFIRVYDGDMWYFSATTNLSEIQMEIDQLVKMATVNPEINENEIVKKFEVNKGESLLFVENGIENISTEEKRAQLEAYNKYFEVSPIVDYEAKYIDNKSIKEFYSSKGANLKFDRQLCGYITDFELASGEKKSIDYTCKAMGDFGEFKELGAFIKEETEKAMDFHNRAEEVEPGQYVVLLSPAATGCFAHECFGHKSESDLMIGDEAMAKEWALGKTVGSELVTIVDDGNRSSNGFTQYDDEGTKAKKTMILTDGVLTGRLHNVETAAIMGEPLTGNGRSIGFDYEPIVRMTTTYIEKGNHPKDEIIKEIENGIYVETVRHGSGLSDFTIAPRRAYKIEQGRITTPVKVSVIAGSVFTALYDVDAISEEFELTSIVSGGCGKNEQYPLPVGFGGPYTRVKKLDVQ